MSTTIRRPATRTSSAPAVNPDAELIRICHEFADVEMARWYRYVVTDEDLADEPDEEVDWDTYHRILATPATTPEGWHAKALAYAALDRDAYDDHEDHRDPCTAFLASLLRDVVAPARNAIVSRCAAKYGPLPRHYTAEGIWVGPTPEEKAEREKEWADRDADRIAAVVAEHRGTQPPVTNVAGQELIGVDEAGNMTLWCTGTIKEVSTLEDNASHPSFIKGGHYVIWWKRHAITVHLSGSRRMLEVLFVCSGLMKTSMMTDEVEALLIGKVSQDGEKPEGYWAEQIKELSKLWQEQRLTEVPGRRRGRISESAAA
jgi:hypothetical protein